MNEQNFLYKAAHLLAPESPLISQSLMQAFARNSTVKLKTYCLHCFQVYIPTVNCHVSLKKKKLIMTCHACTVISRFPLSFATKDVPTVELPKPLKSIIKKNNKRKDLSNLLQTSQPEETGLSLFDFLGQL
jgi:RNase P subunit RPR2